MSTTSVLGATSARPSLLSKAAAKLAAHPAIALATIVALTVLLIALCVYYRGVFAFGPYAKCRPAPPTLTADGGQALAADPRPSAAGDAETERLIATINGAPA